MKKLYAVVSLCSFFWGYSQINLNNPETKSRTVTDPVSITLSQGFRAASSEVEFTARIQDSNSSNPPSSEGGGASPVNPSTPSGTLGSNLFHDTQGNIEVNGAGQLQFTLPIALPPGVKSVAPQVNLVYTSGSGNGIAGYGWNLSGITSISRVGKNIDKDGKAEGISLTYNDYYSFNGQRLILKSGEYGKDGSEYVTEKFSNVKIKAKGVYTIQRKGIFGKSRTIYYNAPAYWEVTFEDGSQAWYGSSNPIFNYGGHRSRIIDESKNPIEYNITKWKDAQGNYIIYNYSQYTNVSVISSIEWGGNETLGKPHFNKMTFQYAERDLKESSFVTGEKFVQNKILTSIQVDTNGKQFKKYVINYHNGENGTKYQFVNNITEYNSNNEPSNPVTFEYQKSNNDKWEETNFDHEYIRGTLGDFDGDGKLDMIEYFDENDGFLEMYRSRPRGYRIFSSVFDGSPKEIRVKTDLESETLKKPIAITFKGKDGVTRTKQGVIFIKYIPPTNKENTKVELHVYSFNDNELKYEFHKSLSPDIKFSDYYIKCRHPQILGNGGFGRKPTWGGGSNGPTICVGEKYNEISKMEEVDLNGDGISEVLLYNSEYEITSQKNKLINESVIVMDSDPQLDDNKSFSSFDTTDLMKSYKGDFNGDGKIDFIRIDDEKRPIISIIEKKHGSSKYTLHQEVFFNLPIEGVISNMLVGDFNGDGKSDIIIPQKENSHTWNMYISSGKSFINKQTVNDIPFINVSTNFERPQSSIERKYFTQDINKDGKSDIIITHSKKYTGTKFIVQVFENTGVDNYGNILFNHRKIQNEDNYTIVNMYNMESGNIYPFIRNCVPKTEETYIGPRYSHSVCEELVIPSYATAYDISTHFLPLIGDFKINNENENILLFHKNKVSKFSSYELNKVSRISAITQGGLRTEIDYKELDSVSTKDPYFYAPVNQEKYPYMELEKISQSYAVSQLRQIISPSQTRKQDFRYRGFITHLQGKGMIGFRKTARSSWYADGFENTKVWNGAEIDPLNEGLPIKEWSIKTNDETQIFPKDVSLNNQSLLSFKSTQYKVDKLVNGVKVSVLSQEDKPKAVTAIVATEVTTKDFIKETTSIDRVEYNELYLPVKTISSTNNGFAEKTTQIEYYPANLSAEGKDYSVGRPRVKTELVRAYGDSKGAKEEYHYENNLLKSLTTYNRDNSGWLKESYEYDGFGNITTKTISNSVDSNTQTSKTEYEDKGRFVIKKTDNLGLITLITYNDWGQVLTQKDPLGNTLTNTYDSWGKLISVSTNLGGTKTYAYEKLNNHDVKVIEYSPDGGMEFSITNKIGQTYRSFSKGFKKNDLISKIIQYDVLGRKIKETEPFVEDFMMPIIKVNTIEYDEYSRPIKATAFTGKIVETKYTKNTVTVTETNANNRFKKQTFDALGNITSTEDKGGIIEFKYNAAGEVIEAKYGTNIVTTKYDAWGRKIEYHDPSKGLYKYEYHHGFGLLTKEISPKGFKEYTYNDKGQLISQKEKSNKQGVTDKEIRFAYNDKGMLLSKIGSSKGKAFSSHIAYDKYGRVIAVSEESFGKKYERKNVVYDPIGRVHSYEKSLTSSGKTTHVVIENVYDSWSGTMYQLKDKSSGKVLWELEELTAKGKVLKAKLGGTSIQNTYDANDFLSAVSHKAEGKPDILSIAYSFNAIKNELNSRNTSGAFNILERFVYDDNNRLINWTNPRTGELHHNVYDKQGRIIENDQLGKIKFENKDKVYQPTGMSLNEKGAELLKNNLIQKIEYNENNDPVFIDGVKGDVRFEYGLTAMRQMMTFGGEFLSENASQNETSHGKFTRFYSEDGSFEVTLDHQSGKEKHILYIGGNPYESEIIFVKDFKEEKGSYKFLHKDYLGSILAISDEEGNKLEQRHYDAWGNLTHLQIGNGEVITDPEQIAKAQLLLDRGYTSHEHLWEVGIIHMNGRLYDPLLRRFLNADENIQDPHNTQNYNKYGYVFNNPLMYNDPSGEFALIPFLIVVGKAAAIGAAVGLASYTIGLAVTGNLHQWNIGGALKATFWGAVSGAVSGGLGELFSAGSVVKALGDAKFLIQAAAHGVSQGVLSVMQGGDFLSGAAGGFFGSLGAELWGGAMKNLGYEKFAQSTWGTVSFGALSGGVGSELSGGNFWQGAVTGGIVAGLNHAMHKMGGEDPRKPIKKIKKFPKFKIIKDNYPKDNPDGSHAHPSKDGYKNQCAIRVGYALKKSGVDISSYDPTNQTSEGYPRWSKGLAMWLRSNYGEPIIRTQEHFDLYWKKGAQGLIYQAPPKGSTVGHIDIIYGGGKTGSGYYSASEIWYWPIK